jgi:hypothetical protein
MPSNYALFAKLTLAPTRCFESLFVNCIADLVGKMLLVEASSQNHAPNAQADKDESSLA